MVAHGVWRRDADRGNRYTGPRFSRLLTQAGGKVPMYGCGSWMNGMFIDMLQ